jgi:uncharacterized NAD(P)/FAD-binding protein YdhS
MNLCIVGGGASGILLLKQLIDKLHHIEINKIKNIFIVDKDGFQGGLAYKTVNDHHILNMHASLMSGVLNDKDDFVKWVEFKSPFNINDGYLPRNVYGKYLNELLNANLTDCNRIKVHAIAETVTNITMDKNTGYCIEMSNKSIITANICILCIGHSSPTDIYNLKNYSGFINDPYTNKSIDFTNCSVGLIGSGLTAIDKALEISAKYKNVKLFSFSRSGLFPKIQPVNNSINESINKFRADVANYVNSTEYVMVDQLTHYIEKCIINYCGESIRFEDLTNNDAHNTLKKDIDSTMSNVNNSYNYLVSISDIMGIAWSKMDIRQKFRFKEKYLSGWMRYRHAIPLKNGVNLLNLLNANKLEAHSIKGSIKFIHKFEINTANNHKIECNYIINCTGSGNIAYSDNSLVNKLLKSGLASKNKYYGINCSYHTNNVIDREGNLVENLFVIGDVTKGEHFFVSGIDHVLDRAQVISNKIVERLN